MTNYQRERDLALVRTVNRMGVSPSLNESGLFVLLGSAMTIWFAIQGSGLGITVGLFVAVGGWCGIRLSRKMQRIACSEDARRGR